jgi:hypothetical protein
MNGRVALEVVHAACMILLGAPASASDCGSQIIGFERSLSQHPGVVGTAPQSIDAQLEHQPTPASIEKAKNGARAEIETILGQAKELDAQGMQDECNALLIRARAVLNP